MALVSLPSTTVTSTPAATATVAAPMSTAALQPTLVIVTGPVLGAVPLGAQVRTRHIIECSFGVLKNRWQCLKERLRVKDVLFTSNVIKACFALHNFIIECNADDFDSEPDLEENSKNEEEDNALSASAGRQGLEFITNVKASIEIDFSPLDAGDPPAQQPPTTTPTPQVKLNLMASQLEKMMILLGQMQNQIVDQQQNINDLET
uniref:DDE Tnp4 domain-containing protein n=1 Tax=Romanomermis culicivorax TaxID=13658 RepID=A0A915JV04_ROMCU